MLKFIITAESGVSIVYLPSFPKKGELVRYQNILYTIVSVVWDTTTDIGGWIAYMQNAEANNGAKPISMHYIGEKDDDKESKAD